MTEEDTALMVLLITFPTSFLVKELLSIQVSLINSLISLKTDFLVRLIFGWTTELTHCPAAKQHQHKKGGESSQRCKSPFPHLQDFTSNQTGVSAATITVLGSAID